MGLDSVELVMAFDEAFGIETSNAEAERLMTPGQVRDLVLGNTPLEAFRQIQTSIIEEIRDVVVRHLNVRPEDVTPEAGFIDDLGFD